MRLNFKSTALIGLLIVHLSFKVVIEGLNPGDGAKFFWKLEAQWVGGLRYRWEVSKILKSHEVSRESFERKFHKVSLSFRKFHKV